MIRNDTRRVSTLSHILLIVMGVLLFYLIVNFGRQVAVSYQRREELRQVQARLLAAQAQNAELAAYLDYARTDAAAEQWAREQGWARAGEVPVILVAPPGGQALDPAQPPAAPPSPATYRQQWWALFFGSRP